MLGRKVEEIEVISSPYPHVALSESLEVYQGLVADFPDESRFGRQIRMHGDLTDGDEEYAELLKESPSWQSLHDWVYSENFITSFLAMFDDEIDLRVKNGDLLFDPPHTADQT